MALAMLTTAFVGFAHTYFSLECSAAPLPSLIIHLLGAISCWISCLSSDLLVARGRVDLHRRLGMAGFPSGLSDGDSRRLGGPPELVGQGGWPCWTGTCKFFYIVPATICDFCVLIFFAIRAPQSRAHKRLILWQRSGCYCRHRPLADTFLFRCCHAALMSYISCRPGGLRPLDFAQGSPCDTLGGGFLILSADTDTLRQDSRMARGRPVGSVSRAVEHSFQSIWPAIGLAPLRHRRKHDRGTSL